MTVNRMTEKPLASAEISDEAMDQAYAVEVSLYEHNGGRTHRHMSADEAQAFAAELNDAAAEAINKYRADNPPAEPFDAHPEGIAAKVWASDERYVWITRPEHAGIGIFDRDAGKVAWWPFALTEQYRRNVHANLTEPGGQPLPWAPATMYQPFEIAVFA